MNLTQTLNALDALQANINALRQAVLIVDAVDNPPSQDALQQATKTLMSSFPSTDIIDFAEGENELVRQQTSTLLRTLLHAENAYLSGTRTALCVRVEHAGETDINGNKNSTLIIQVALPQTSLLLHTTVTEIRDNCEYRSEPSMALGAQQFLLNGSPMHDKLQEFLPEVLKDFAVEYTSGYKNFLSFHHAMAPFYTAQDVADARALISKNALLLGVCRSS